MLAKAVSAGIDWVTYLPLALCAIRMVPNADTGFSSYEIAFGRRMSGPLDIVYSGWVEDRFQVDDVSAEKNYSITELESLALVSSVCHFEHYLYGQSFVAHTPCLALISSGHLNKRSRRLALKLQEYDVELRHRPGSSNANADGMFRKSWDLEDVAGLGSSDPPGEADRDMRGPEEEGRKDMNRKRSTERTYKTCVCI